MPSPSFTSSSSVTSSNPELSVQSDVNYNSRSVIDTYPSKRQKTIVESIKSVQSYSDGGLKNIKITNSILYMICRDYQPFSIVDDEGFQNLLKLLTGGLYKIPSRTTIKSLLDKKYDTVSNIFRRKIKDLSYTLTTDIWTETLQTRSFLGITLHYIENCHLDSASLGVVDLSERHTSQYIQKILTEIMNDWNIDAENVTAIVTDGAKNITNAVETLFDKSKHLHCFAHQINLVAERSIESVEGLTDLIKKMKNIITWLKQSVNASDELRQAQEPNNVKKLIQGVPTRWNSTFYAINRFLELRGIINQIINQNTTAPDMINAREANELKEVEEILRPLEAATREMCGEKYFTGSIVIPMIYNIRKKTEASTPIYEIGKKLKEAILKECSKRFDSAEQVHLLAISTLLDPRFKKVYFMSPINCAKTVQMIQEEIQGEIIRTNQNQNKNTDCRLVTVGKILMQ